MKSRCPKGCPCPEVDMYECIEMPDQPITSSTTSTTVRTSPTIHWNWRDGMDQNDLKVLRILSIFELVIAFVMIGTGSLEKSVIFMTHTRTLVSLPN